MITLFAGWDDDCYQDIVRIFHEHRYGSGYLLAEVAVFAGPCSVIPEPVVEPVQDPVNVVHLLGEVHFLPSALQDFQPLQPRHSRQSAQTCRCLPQARQTP